MFLDTLVFESLRLTANFRKHFSFRPSCGSSLPEALSEQLEGELSEPSASVPKFSGLSQRLAHPTLSECSLNDLPGGKWRQGTQRRKGRLQQRLPWLPCVGATGPARQPRSGGE